jgi:DNA-binding transcriptional LysR family regulator
MSLNPRQIEVFRAIMVTGSVSGASRLLHVSQPAVSRLLSYTEQSLGFSLFERIKSRLVATHEGKELFREIEQVYRGIQRVNERARELGERNGGVLHLVSSRSLGHQIMPDAITRFRQANDEVKITFNSLNVLPLLDALITRRAELGFTLSPVEHPNMTVVPLCTADVVCIFPVDHPFARLKSLSVSDLRGQPLVAYNHGTPFAHYVETVFDQADEKMTVAVEVASPQEACSMVLAGAGIAIVDTFSFRSRMSLGLEARALPNTPELTASLVYLRQEPLSRLARDFSETLALVTQAHGYRMIDDAMADTCRTSVKT